MADEDARLALELSRPAAGGLVGDLGCGYGRHLRALAARRPGPLLGIDRSALLLEEAARTAPRALLARADLRALPLRPGSLAAAFCFYSSMFLGADEDAVLMLREARRALSPAGRLVLTTDNPLRLARTPVQALREEVAGLGLVEEEGTFDAATGVDEVRRKLRRPDGQVLSATFRIRYYLPAGLAALAGAAGLSLLRLEPDAPLTADTPQLVALLAVSS